MTTDYFIVLGSAPADALVASFSSPSPAPKPIFPRSDAALVRLRFMRPNPAALAGRLFIDVPQTEVNGWPSVKFGGGVIGSQPNGGTFTLTDTGAAQTSAAEAYNITAAALQTNLRATLTTHFSTCTVTGDDGGPFSIEANNTAGVTLTGNATQLAPDGSTIEIEKTQDGNGSSLKNRWIVKPTKALPILCTTWDPFDPPLVTPSVQVAGSGTVCKSYTVVWNNDAYDGAVYLTYYNGTDTFTVGPISYNAGTADIASLFAALGTAGDNTVAVSQAGPGNYTITFIGTENAFDNTPTLANLTNTLQVPYGLTGVAVVSSAGASDILDTDSTGAITLEIEIKPDSDQVTTAAQVDATIDADLIGNTPGFQTGLEDWATIGDVENISEHIFANDAARVADTPYRQGQIGYQSDTNTFWWAQSTSTGDWSATFLFGGIVLGIAGVAAGQAQFWNAAGTFSTVVVAPNSTATRTLIAPDLSGTLAVGDWLIKTTTASAKAFDKIQADTTGSAWTLTLPASATVGDSIQVEDAAGTWATNNLTIARNGLKINNGTANYTGNLTGQKLSIVYISAGYGWSIK